MLNLKNLNNRKSYLIVFGYDLDIISPETKPQATALPFILKLFNNIYCFYPTVSNDSVMLNNENL